MTIKHFLPGLLATLLLASTAYLWLSPGAIRAAPDVRARTLDGDDFRLSNLRGRPVLVTFWATTCGGCLEEMPRLIELYKELAPKGLEIVGVAMSYDPPNRVVTMRLARNIPYPLVLDINGNLARTFGDVRQTPTSFLIAPDGMIAARRTGGMDMVELRDRILEMVRGEG